MTEEIDKIMKKHQKEKAIEYKLDDLFRDVHEINDTLKQIRTLLAKMSGYQW